MSWNTSSLPRVRITTKSVHHSSVAGNPFNPNPQRMQVAIEQLQPKRFAGSSEFDLLRSAQAGDSKNLKSLEGKLNPSFNPLKPYNQIKHKVTKLTSLASNKVQSTATFTSQMITRLSQVLTGLYDKFAAAVNLIWSLLTFLVLPFKLVLWLLVEFLKMISYLVSPR